MVVRKNQAQPARPKRPRATTPEGAENHLISLAVDLAERQLMEGTASSQVITHYLKLGSSRERLEQAKLEMEHKLMTTKIEQMASTHRTEELMTEALRALKRYSGNDDEEETDGTELY